MRRLAVAIALLLALSVSVASADGGNVLTLESTAYEETGNRMANGEWPYFGAVACNILPLGTRIKVLDGPFEGQVFVVKDRIGHSSMLDFYLGDVQTCLNYGRRMVTIVVLPEGPDIPALFDEFGARAIGQNTWLLTRYGARVIADR